VTSRKVYRPGAACAALAFLAALVAVAPAAEQGWGTIKGQVVFAGDKAPAPRELNVDKDKEHCLSKGKLYDQRLVVNKKNKGVRWVLVWLTDPANPKNAAFVPPIHPSLKNPKPTVEIDQPCCVFEPRMIGVQVGQKLIVKNPAPIPHNFKIESFGSGPTANPLIPPGGQAVIAGFVPKPIPTEYSCSIHGWMKGWIGSFPHPYFAVTDADGKFEIKNAPAGKFRLMLWQEEAGWVIRNPKKPADRGKVIEVKANGTTDVGKVPLKVAGD
jgi:hypothetical protein